ncbi:MAG: hypothetical protein JWQ06_2073 [Mucilaginibacter sp.]|nr:hypothetical protein [Mucilaginibacter sp.]
MAALNFLTITNFVESVIEDVERIGGHPLVSTDITIIWLYL